MFNGSCFEHLLKVSISLAGVIMSSGLFTCRYLSASKWFDHNGIVPLNLICFNYSFLSWLLSFIVNAKVLCWFIQPLVIFFFSSSKRKVSSLNHLKFDLPFRKEDIALLDSYYEKVDKVLFTLLVYDNISKIRTFNASYYLFRETANFGGVENKL